MNYHPDDWLALIEEVGEQGGAHLVSETCKPRRFQMKQPKNFNNPGGPQITVMVEGAGCNREAKFLVPMLDDPQVELFYGDELDIENHFDFDDSIHPEAMMADGETPVFAKVCAIEDAMGLWPRFADEMQTGESYEDEPPRI